MNQPTIKEGVRLGRRVYLTGDEAALFAVITPTQLTRLQETGALTGDWSGVFLPSRAELRPPDSLPPSADSLVTPVVSDTLATNEEVVAPTPTEPEIMAATSVENTEAPGNGAGPVKPVRGKSKPAESKPELNEEK